MKKFILLLIFLLFMIPKLAESECATLCTDPWVYEEVIADFNGCSYFVTFGYKECNGKREVKIANISTYSTCPYSTNRILLMELAIKKVLNMAHTLFSSMTPSSNDVLVYTDCCWSSTTGTDKTDWSPCLSDCCCITNVSIKDSTRPGGGKIYTLEGKTVISDADSYDCSKDPSGSTVNCYEMCSAMDNIDLGENLESTTFQCTDTCSSEWNYADPLEGDDDCEPDGIWYTKRECGGVTQIRFSSFAYKQRTPTNCDMEEVIKEAIEEILLEEATNYTLPRSFEINMPTCYKFVNYKYAQVCYWNDNCCLVSYRVTEKTLPDPDEYYANDYNLDTLVGFVNCGLDLDCEFICDSVYVYVDKYSKLDKKFNPIIEENIFETNTEIYPNPTKDLITFEVTTKFPMELELIIYTEIGKEVDRMKIQNQNGKLIYTYDSKQLSKGVYLFKIIAGINAIDAGKFIKE